MKALATAVALTMATAVAACQHNDRPDVTIPCVTGIDGVELSARSADGFCPTVTPLPKRADGPSAGQAGYDCRVDGDQWCHPGATDEYGRQVTPGYYGGKNEEH